MSLRRFALIFVTAFLFAGCSRRPAAADSDNADSGKQVAQSKEERANETEASPGEDNESGESATEEEQQPDRSEIAEDAVAYTYLTKTVPAEGQPIPVFALKETLLDEVSPAGDTCEAAVTVRVSFNPSKGEAITGGLVGWITPEQLAAYARGETPPGEQVYHFKITYRRNGAKWQPLEIHR